MEHAPSRHYGCVKTINCAVPRAVVFKIGEGYQQKEHPKIGRKQQKHVRREAEGGRKEGTKTTHPLAHVVISKSPLVMRLVVPFTTAKSKQKTKERVLDIAIYVCLYIS